MGDIGNMPQFVNRKVETLENKDIDGGKASNQSRIGLPKGTTAELAALQRKVGVLAWDTTLGMLVVDSGAGFAAAGGGGTPVGPNGAVQFNNAGSLDGNADLTYDGAGNLFITSAVVGNVFVIGSSIVPAVNHGASLGYGGTQEFLEVHALTGSFPTSVTSPNGFFTNVGIGTTTPQRDIHIFSAAGEPTVLWTQDSQAADNKNWQVTVSGGDWYLQAVDDAFSGFTAIKVNRTGATVDSVEFPPNLQLGAHVNSSGAQATIDPGGDAGAGAVAIANISATDKAGRVRVTTGTGAVNGQLVEITFATPYVNPPSVVVTPEGALAGGLGVIRIESVSASGFVIANLSGVADATEYDFCYQVIGLE